MAKYLVETYYTCSLKVTHYLEDISEKELIDLEKRDDGKFEILDIKLDNRKTKNLSKNLNNLESKVINNNEVVNDESKKINQNDFDQNNSLKVSHGKKQHVIVKII